MSSEHVARKVLVATNNTHKLQEIRSAFTGRGYEFISLAEAGIVSNPEETGATFLENARIKAQAAREASGGVMAVLADDSGLEVDALYGRPGVFSSRYAGEDVTDADNNRKLLQEMARVPHMVRDARFKTVLVFLDEAGGETIATGVCEGRIATEPCGEYGFGYDPLFLTEDHAGKTMAQLTEEEKNAISHRGRALRELSKALLQQD